MKHIKGTGAFAAQKGSKNKTFREEYILPYSLIGFYGIINENAAKYTGLTEEDVKLLIEGMWEGTKNLISRSKFGQVPRLLIKVNYSERNFYIGELKEYIKLKSDLMDEKIRDISDFTLDISALLDILRDNDDKIESIDYIIDDRVELTANGEMVNLNEINKFKAFNL
ncbi:MAG: CRISPR-associated protein Csh2 [Halanaerobiales bacterium]|nr:CRISPR-associated protein Csh2 [Halanaerobiales bacterium]